MSGDIVNSGTVGAASGVRGAVTSPASRMAALARAELTLLGRSKSTLVTAVLIPLVLPLSFANVIDDMDVEDIGLTTGLVLVPAAIGFSCSSGCTRR